jgi:hypothetical protein
MIKFRTYSQIRRGQEIGGFHLYSSPGELLNDMEGKEYVEFYGGFSVWNFKDQGLVAEKSPLNDGINEGGLYYEDMKNNLEYYFKINDSPNAFRSAWFKTREGAQRFLDKYGKENPGGECLSLWAPPIMLFNE